MISLLELLSISIECSVDLYTNYFALFSYKMDTNKPSKSKHAFSSGLIMGLVLMILSLVTYVFELYDQKWFNYVSWVALGVGIYLAVKKYRDEVAGGYISYGSALGYGVLFSFIASLVASIVNYIYLGYIDDGFITYTLEQAEMQMYESGQSDEQIEMAISMTRKMTSPIMMGIWGVFGITLLGLVLSLIISAFVKKEENPFS